MVAMACINSLVKPNAVHRLPPLPTIRDLIRLYKLRALKQFSQNFLMDERLTDKIVRAAGKIKDGYVLEIGPGPGSITRSILKQYPKHLVVVEKDRRFMPTLDILKESVHNAIEMDIIRDDILNFRCEHAFPECKSTDWMQKDTPNVHLIGNLPFAISTRLLINWLKDMSLKQGAWSYGRSSLTLTFQLEVAQRIVAGMADEQRCRLSLMSQLWAKPELKFVIPGKAFVPKPEVDVGVVTIVPLKTPKTDLPFDLIEKIMRYIFSMRQKYVRRGIQNLFPPLIRDEMTLKIFKDADVNPELRSFQLSNDECVRIARVYYEIIQKYPKIDEYNYRSPYAERLLWDTWDLERSV